jgi:arylsulfatase A-like enzyme
VGLNNFSRRNFILGTAGAAVLHAAKKPVQRPNVVIVVASDLGSWMLGCYGNKEIRTPNIDILSRSGMRFVNSYTSAPVGPASRPTLFTGRVPRQLGIADAPQEASENRSVLLEKETTISDVLSSQGYNCGYVGNWDSANRSEPKHGLQYTYTTAQGPATYQNPEMSTNGKVAPEQGYLTELTTQHACGFLERQKAEKPFFLTISYLNPRAPYDGHPPKYYEMYTKTNFDSFGFERAAPNALHKDMLKDTVANLRKCAATTTALDDQIPIVLRKLQDAKLRDNTLVIFTADCGSLLGRHGLWGDGFASDPMNMYDEVMQVPMLWSWPGKIPTDAITAELIGAYDLLPSVCEITGSGAPQGRNLCGRSYAPLALRERLPKKQPWKNTVFADFHNTGMTRDSRFKLVVRNGGKGPNEFFDLSADPREKVNQYANAQYITVRDQLARELEDWRRRTS